MDESNHEKSSASENDRREKLARREFLGIGTTVLAAAGAGQAVSAFGQQKPSPPPGDRSRSFPGPRNVPLEEQNPDSTLPPSTDYGGVPTFKYPFAFANKRLYKGGWSREVTVRELPISKTIAGVNMRLTAGGVRELHWHAAGSGQSCFTATRGSRRLTRRGRVSCRTWGRMICGFSRRAFRI